MRFFSFTNLVELDGTPSFVYSEIQFVFKPETRCRKQKKKIKAQGGEHSELSESSPVMETLVKFDLARWLGLRSESQRNSFNNKNEKLALKYGIHRSVQYSHRVIVLMPMTSK